MLQNNALLQLFLVWPAPAVVCCAPCKQVCYGTMGKMWIGAYKERGNCLDPKNFTSSNAAPAFVGN